RLVIALPRAVTRVPDFIEFHLVFLQRLVVVAADSIESNVGRRRLAILVKMAGVLVGPSAPECFILPGVIISPANLIVDCNTRVILDRESAVIARAVRAGITER